jgi:putative intracellular protease/amidase
MVNITIGVFIPHDAQFLDVATVDVLGTISREYLSVMPDLPEQVVSHAPSVRVYYITSPANPTGEIPLTTGIKAKATHFYTDDEVAPGRLDIILVPGPNPFIEFHQGALGWLKAQAETEGVDILSVCTGAFICAAAGILRGKKASGPMPMQGILSKRFPDVEWVGGNQRWVQDGNIWSSGGVTNGNDLMAAYARVTKKYWPTDELVELGLSMTDVGDRSQFYCKL